MYRGIGLPTVSLKVFKGPKRLVCTSPTSAPTWAPTAATDADKACGSLPIDECSQNENCAGEPNQMGRFVCVFSEASLKEERATAEMAADKARQDSVGQEAQPENIQPPACEWR